MEGKKVLWYLVIWVFVLSSCASPQRTRYREGDNSGQQTALTVADEQRMTEEVLPQMQKDYPALPSPALQNYISKLGKQLVAANGLEGNPYHYTFTVVEVDAINAFALPAGTVFVTAPLIAMAATEAELAGVIGHEIGHVIARHTAERIEKEKKDRTKNIVTVAGGAVLGTLAGWGAGKMVCPKEDKKCQNQALLAGAAVGAGGGLLISKYQFFANSREDEMEADRIGHKVATRAGFSKDHVGLFYQRLLEMEQAHSDQNNSSPILVALSDAMSTHPPSKERVQQMAEMTASASAPKQAIVSSEQFQKAQGQIKAWMQARKKE